MKGFKSFLTEEVDQYLASPTGDNELKDASGMRNINLHLKRVSSDQYVTPHIGLNRIRQTLAYFNIALPRFDFGNTDEGETAFEILPWGGVTGRTKDGDPILGDDDDTNYLYMAWRMNDQGMFDLEAEVMSEADLEDILGADDDDAEVYDDAEDEYDHHGRGYDYDSSIEEGTEFVLQHKKTKKVLSSHKSFDSAKDERSGLGKDAGDYGIYKSSKRGQPAKGWGMNEGRMPASVIKHKQKISQSSDDENKKRFAGKSKEKIAGMARRHGYGTKNPYAKHHDGITEDSMNEVSRTKADAASQKALKQAKHLSLDMFKDDPRQQKLAGKKLRQAHKFDKYRQNRYINDEYELDEARFKPLSAQNDETRSRINSRLKDDDDDGGKHIVMQLRKVVSMNGDKPVMFANGKTAKVSPGTARMFLKKYSGLSKPMDKEKLQAKAGASYDALRKCISEALGLGGWDMSTKSGKGPTRKELLSQLSKAKGDKNISDLSTKARRLGASQNELKKALGISEGRTPGLRFDKRYRKDHESTADKQKRGTKNLHNMVHNPISPKKKGESPDEQRARMAKNLHSISKRSLGEDGQIDELSPATLRRYRKAADTAFITSTGMGDSLKTANKRYKGSELARKKLGKGKKATEPEKVRVYAKEENLDELDLKTVASYQRKVFKKQGQALSSRRNDRPFKGGHFDVKKQDEPASDKTMKNLKRKIDYGRRANKRAQSKKVDELNLAGVQPSRNVIDQRPQPSSQSNVVRKQSKSGPVSTTKGNFGGPGGAVHIGK